MRVLWLVLLIGCGGSPPRTADGSGAKSTANSAGGETTIDTTGSTSVAPSTGNPSPSFASASTPDSDRTVVIGAIAAAGHFDPKSTLDDLRPDLMACFRRVHASNATLHGKVSIRIQIDEAGEVLNVDAQPGGPANDPALIACIRDDFKANARFARPGGSATIVAPLVFHP
jgi:hypothetical protein